MSGESKWRFKYIIYPQFQYTLVAINSFILFVVITVFGVQIYRSFAYINGLGVRANLPPDHNYFKFINIQTHNLMVNMTIASFISLVFSVLFTIYFSHRLVGPIVRLKAHFLEIFNNGIIRPINFRKTDYFTDLAEVVNNALEKMKK
ncbi:MAG: hypothetical protein A2504_09485 [Bdellovibrionales bacterium RIFOXYD12_FULL_39_22]|nr:MAG: hypothetical protein A2385_12975 [Bdellovibrionales bacterium RIFOXYB1_FULL_39_21]OFZ40958.1 MAG: hypothetical protein A2485_16485 [Bdellovibrionales bacterium RIFOXYC12_FULL_39_17]OFZ44786.1 MAG: hypothetical protein A2404_09775 [Bdellovibrionales bacterium RIFOXYC1_FULL_39_130]OFZ73599.1 MAG: hypothetical protein A2451_06485 [Bdellovibrionales bacterium RIFOXYC2_FULL_39_8]OFZ74251.1 MAG: hypothetical protein A2560_16740 [Bdellovibrionales bacterium RIFOXYD1_FULL_39_84]OFZ92115.1 MAG: